MTGLVKVATAPKLGAARPVKRKMPRSGMRTLEYLATNYSPGYLCAFGAVPPNLAAPERNARLVGALAAILILPWKSACSADWYSAVSPIGNRRGAHHESCSELHATQPRLTRMWHW